MPAPHVFESAFHSLIRAYAEFGRSPISVPVFMESEGLNAPAGIGWMRLARTDTGFIVEFSKERKQ